MYGPHVGLIIRLAHPLQYKAYYMKEILVGQIIEANQPLLQVGLFCIRQRNILLLLDKEGTRYYYNTLKDKCFPNDLSSIGIVKDFIEVKKSLWVLSDSPPFFTNCHHFLAEPSSH